MNTVPTVEKEINLRLTERECNVIANLFDAAIKSAGLPAAEAAMPLMTKIRQELQTAIQPAVSIPRIPGRQ